MGRVGAYRWGQVKHMALEQRVKLARLIVALDEDDKEAVVAAYIDMGIRTKRMGEYILGLHTSECCCMPCERDKGDRGRARPTSRSFARILLDCILF